MAKTPTAESISVQLHQLVEATRAEVLRDLIIDLKDLVTDFAKEGKSLEFLQGIGEVMEYIRENNPDIKE